MLQKLPAEMQPGRGVSRRALLEASTAVEATSYAGTRSSNDPKFVEPEERRVDDGAVQGTSPVIKELVTSKAVKTSGAMYDLSSARVEFLT